jgi:hypothetical protein
MLNKDLFDELFVTFSPNEFEVLEYLVEAMDTLMKTSINISFLFCGKTCFTVK